MRIEATRARIRGDSAGFTNPNNSAWVEWGLPFRWAKQRWNRYSRGDSRRRRTHRVIAGADSNGPALRL